ASARLLAGCAVVRAGTVGAARSEPRAVDRRALAAVRGAARTRARAVGGRARHARLRSASGPSRSGELGNRTQGRARAAVREREPVAALARALELGWFGLGFARRVRARAAVEDDRAAVAAGHDRLGRGDWARARRASAAGAAAQSAV